MKIRKNRILITLTALIVTLISCFQTPLPASAKELSFQEQVKIMNDAPDFKDLVEYAEYAKFWLGICPAIVKSRQDNPDISLSAIKSINKQLQTEGAELALKICTAEQQDEVKDFIKYLLSINVYGSCDLRLANSVYNLPGAVCEIKIKSGNGNFSERTETSYSEITLFNPSVAEFFTNTIGSGVDVDFDVFKKIYQNDDIAARTNTIFNSCSGQPNTDQYIICNKLLNTSEGSVNQNLFSPTNLSANYLQQMHFNMLDNANLINDGVYNINFKKEFTDEFGRDFLNPTILFGRNHDFKFKSIGVNNDLAKAKVHLVPGGLGWLIDMLTSSLTKAAEGAYKVLANWFLVIKVEVFANAAVKQVWSNFRDIANVCFVLIFIVVVFSQLTGRGLSNYSIKKILPKLIASVILVNLSFYITQAAIDISNIIGKSLFNLLVGIPQLSGGFVREYSKFEAVAGSIANIISILLLAFVSLLSLLATIANIMLLAVRDAVVLLLIIVSPVALVSGLSNATSRFFSIWSKTLFSVLSIFPIISGLVGGALLVDQILMSDQDTGMLLFLTSKLALFGSLTMIPLIVTKTMSQITGTLSIGGIGLFGKIPSPLGRSPGEAVSKAYRFYGNSRFGKFAANRKQQRNLMKRASKSGSFWARAATQAQGQLASQRQKNAEMFSQSEAEALVDFMANGNSSNISNQTMAKYNVVKNTYGAKETALALAMAQSSDNKSENQTNGHNILKAMNIAKQNGASQSDLKTVTESVLKQLKDKKDFRSTGLIKANLDYHNGEYGEFDQKLLSQADQHSKNIPSDSNVQNMNNLINKHTQESMRQHVVADQQNNGLLQNLSANSIAAGSVANEVFIKEVASSKSNRDNLIRNYHLISPEVQDIIGIDHNLMNQISSQVESAKTDAEAESYAKILEHYPSIEDYMAALNNNSNVIDASKIYDQILNQQIINSPQIETIKQQILDGILKKNGID